MLRGRPRLYLGLHVRQCKLLFAVYNQIRYIDLPNALYLMSGEDRHGTLQQSTLRRVSLDGDIKVRKLDERLLSEIFIMSALYTIRSRPISQQ